VRAGHIGALVAAVTGLLGAAWCAARAETPAALRAHGGPVKAVAPLADGRTLVSGSFDSTIVAWDLTTGTPRRVLRFHGSTVNALAALTDGCFASGGEDGRVAVWCGAAATPVAVLEGHTAPVTQVAVAPDGRTVASASFDHTVRVWARDGGPATARVLAGASAPLTALTFSADGAALLAGGYDGTVRLWPLTATGATPTAPAPTTLALGGPVNAAAAMADGRFVVAGADGHVRVLSPTLTVAADIDVGSGPLTTVAVTPDGRTVATAGMRTQVTLIDLPSGTTRFEILGPGLPVWTLAFLRDGQELVTGGQDRVVRRWSTATGQPAGPDPAPPASDVVAVLPQADHPGAAVFRACSACHGVTPADTGRAGPTLAGLFGRRIGTAPGYDYSPALQGMAIVWTRDTVAELFTRGPLAYTPGTKMPEQRITDRADLDALLDWLQAVTAVER
jgi:cytochrome c